MNANFQIHPNGLNIYILGPRLLASKHLAPFTVVKSMESVFIFSPIPTPPYYIKFQINYIVMPVYIRRHFRSCAIFAEIASFSFVRVASTIIYTRLCTPILHARRGVCISTRIPYYNM